MFDRRICRFEWVVVAWWLIVQPAVGVTIHIDYSYDTNHFFGSGNPQGAAAGSQAKASVEAAASFYSSILTDSFSSITVPQSYPSTAPGSNGVYHWDWQEQFPNPSSNSGTQVNVQNPNVGSDQYVVYVGGSSLTGGEAGRGGPGGYTYSTSITGTDSFTTSDNVYISATTASFTTAITTRGQQDSKFSRWGGAITFDNDSSSTWFFDQTGTPAGNVIDFYSVALHELAHTIGFGASSDWQALVSGTNFVGGNAITQNGGSAVPLSADLSHWANGKTSVIYGSSTPQETLMDPDLTNGTRKRLTELDAAALKDIGWSLAPAPANLGDYNNNGFVDAPDYVLWRKYVGQSVSLPNRGAAGTITLADYNVWRTNFGKTAFGSGSGALVAGGAVPEPATRFLAVVFGLIALTVKRRRYR